MAFDEKGKDHMKAWHISEADVDAVQMVPGVQEDQQIQEWEYGDEHNMRSKVWVIKWLLSCRL